MQLDAQSEMGGGQRRRAAAQFHSIWIFLIADSVSFGLLFLVFMIERLKQAELFAESARHLNEGLGLINTAILITGSWLVARAVASARNGDGITTRKHLIFAIGVSSCFAIIKLFEYASKISAGITPVSNDFYTFYYALTGFHLVHYLLGMAALIYLARSAPRISQGNKQVVSRLEAGALFWHLVDLLWIYIFAMLYLLGVQS